MNPTLQDTLEALVDGLARELAVKGAANIVAEVAKQGAAKADDPLLSVVQAASRLGLSETTVRTLTKAGILKRARGLRDIRIRQSVVDRYGTEQDAAS